jgi:hypothetical protein
VRRRTRRCLNIPYFGIIHIGQRTTLGLTGEEPEITRFEPTILTITEPLLDHGMDQSQRNSNEGYSQPGQLPNGGYELYTDNIPNFDPLEDWTFQNIDEALFSSVFNNIDNPNATHNSRSYNHGKTRESVSQESSSAGNTVFDLLRKSSLRTGQYKALRRCG